MPVSLFHKILQGFFLLGSLQGLLGETKEPLSFIIFIPEWRDPPTEALMRLESSLFKKKQIILPPYGHEYRPGFQHTCAKYVYLDHLLSNSPFAELDWYRNEEVTLSQIAFMMSLLFRL